MMIFFLPSEDFHMSKALHYNTKKFKGDSKDMTCDFAYIKLLNLNKIAQILNNIIYPIRPSHLIQW